MNIQTTKMGKCTCKLMFTSPSSLWPHPHVYVLELFCSFSHFVHTQTVIQHFQKSLFSPKTETFKNGFESGDFRKRRLSKTLRCRVDGQKQRLLKMVLI